SKMFLKKSTLHLHDHSTHARGRIADFLEKRQLDSPITVAAFYRTLFEEIKRRTNHETEAGQFDRLLGRKGIAKAEFQRMIDALRRPRDFDVLRGQITPLLREDGMSFLAIDTVFRDWRRIELERRGNAIPASQWKASQQAVADIRAAGGDLSLK